MSVAALGRLRTSVLESSYLGLWLFWERKIGDQLRRNPKSRSDHGNSGSWYITFFRSRFTVFSVPAIVLSDVSLQGNHREGWLTSKLLIPSQSFWFHCIADQISGEMDTVGPRITLQETHCTVTLQTPVAAKEVPPGSLGKRGHCESWF